VIIRITDAKQGGYAFAAWHTKQMPTPMDDHSAARLGGERGNSLWFVVPGTFDFDVAVYLEDDRAVVLDGDEVAVFAAIPSVVRRETCLDPVNFVPGQIQPALTWRHVVAHVAPHRTWHYHRLEAGW